MIGRLRGVIVSKRPTELVIDVHGTGYEASIPVSTFDRLGAEGDEATIVVHTHVREDAIQLFAFASEAERTLFRVLIGVSGIGPKLALAVLSGMGVDEFRRAVGAGDAARLQAIPGVGKRTAERLVVELRDRLGIGAAARRATAEVTAMGCAPEVFRDAVAALAALGYSEASAGAAARKALEDLDHEPTLEDLVKSSLALAQGR